MVEPLWNIVSQFLGKLNIELPYDPAIPRLHIYPDKTVVQKDTRPPLFIAALLTRAETWKHPRCPRQRRIKQMWRVYAMECCSARREGSNATRSDTDATRDGQTNASERDAQTYTRNPSHDTDELGYKTDTESGQRQTGGVQGGGIWGRAGAGWGWQMEALYTEPVNSKSYCIAQGTVFSIL